VEHRLRVVFALERSIVAAQDWAGANLALAFRLGADLSISDKARCLFWLQQSVNVELRQRDA
jgi:hypothetical protein